MYVVCFSLKCVLYVSFSGRPQAAERVRFRAKSCETSTSLTSAPGTSSAMRFRPALRLDRQRRREFSVWASRIDTFLVSSSPPLLVMVCLRILELHSYLLPPFWVDCLRSKRCPDAWIPKKRTRIGWLCAWLNLGLASFRGYGDSSFTECHSLFRGLWWYKHDCSAFSLPENRHSENITVYSINLFGTRYFLHTNFNINLKFGFIRVNVSP